MTMFATVVISVLVTLAVVVIYHNASSPERKMEHNIDPEYGVGDPQFCRVMSNLLGPAVVDGNTVEHLENGDAIFASMLEAIRGAERTITFETYVYWEADIGREFAEALAERARAGVAVHVLIDWQGGFYMEQALCKLMEDAGVQVEFYHPLHWWSVSRLNHRTHRKLLVVDGKVGFTGGVGIADEWRGNAEDEDHWRDSHFRITGPAVAQLQAAFTDNWLKTHARVLHETEYFPPLERTGDMRCQVFKSSPREGSGSARLLFMMSIAAAKQSIRIGNSYFVPDTLAVKELARAAKRGVHVEIVVPGPHMDVKAVRKASRGRWGKLLKAGVKIYEFQPTMYHTKMLIIDETWVSVGSTNFDNRSFRLNDEANLNILDKRFGHIMCECFERDKSRSKLITYAQWKKRPWQERILEKAASLVRGQL